MKSPPYSFLLGLILVLSGFYVAQAQKLSNRENSKYIHLQAHAGLPLGNMIGKYKLLLGTAIQLDFPLKQKVVFFTTSAAYQQFIPENQNGENLKNTKILPLKIGLRFFPIEQLYLQVDFGPSFVLNKLVTSSDKSAVWTFSNEIGYHYAFHRGNVAEVGLVFHRIAALQANGSAQSFFGIKTSFGLAY